MTAPARTCRPRGPGRQRMLLAAAAAALVLSGCSAADADPAGTGTVPALSSALAELDDALARRDYPEARHLLKVLLAETREQRAAGAIDDARAGRILAAAKSLLTRLPSATSPSDASSQDPGGQPTAKKPGDRPTRKPTRSAPSAPAGGSGPTAPAPAPPRTSSAPEPSPSGPASSDPATPGAVVPKDGAPTQAPAPVAPGAP